ncbi:unnamed protein product, partial [Linum tenue]
MSLLTGIPPVVNAAADGFRDPANTNFHVSFPLILLLLLDSGDSSPSSISTLLYNLCLISFVNNRMSQVLKW